MTDIKPEATDLTYGTGEVVTAHFSRGTPIVPINCEQYCDCPEHDYARAHPKAPGAYVEVHLGNRDARVSVGPVVVLTEDEYDALRAQALAPLWGYAQQIADRYGDDWDHEPGCLVDGSNGCPLCRILDATNPYREPRDE